jgi:DNA-directed RNA polymerase subunit omega
MARITIEDCMEQIPNRFQLVRMASIRAKQLKKGARPLLTSEENKEVVMSLREIAAGLVKPGDAAPPEPVVEAAVETDTAEASAATPVDAPEIASPGESEASDETETPTA